MVQLTYLIALRTAIWLGPFAACKHCLRRSSARLATLSSVGASYLIALRTAIWHASDMDRAINSSDMVRAINSD